MLIIDGVTYSAEWETGNYIQTAEILNGANAGRLQNTGDMFLDPMGTFFNSSGTILKSGCSTEEWDALFRVLCNPLGEHTVEIPFDQGWLETKIYISTAQRRLLRREKNRNVWGNSYEITFTAMDSQWPAGKELTGYRKGV